MSFICHNRKKNVSPFVVNLLYCMMPRGLISHRPCNGFHCDLPDLQAALDSLVQALHKGLIVTVGGHVGGNTSSDVKAEEVKISDQIQYLVAHEFVGITEFRVDDL